ncbi:UNVERIFIED_ORG: nucleoid-associated protein YgaU [Martelella mediterranea]
MNKNNTRVIIAVIILVLVAAGAYFMLRDKDGDVAERQDSAPATQTTESAAPEPDHQQDTAESAGTTADGADDETRQAAQLRIPTFDVLRVEPDGTAVIAGAAEPLGVLDVKEDDTVLASSEVTDTGDFVAIVETPLTPGDHLLYLNVTMPDGRSARSQQTATVSIPEDDSGELLALITEPGKASEIISAPELQSSLPDDTLVATTPTAGEDEEAAATGAGNQGNVSGDDRQDTDLPAVNVETAGEGNGAQTTAEQEPAADREPVDATVSIKAVEIEDNMLFIAGEGAPDAIIRGYIDDAFLSDGSVNTDGNYVLEAETDVSVGVHTIRVDMLDEDNQVIARAIVPFDRPPGDQIAAVSADSAGTSAAQTDGTRTFTQPQLQGSDNAVIIRRGDNLWRISRRVYGRGVRYTTIYLANETQILNPDLILPGQVFSLPGQPLPDSEAETIHRRLLEGMPVGPEYQLPPEDR